MSAIETYLQYIASKVWARDVRTAIVNAIRQCYDDVHNPTLNTEALQAAIQAKIDAGQMAALTIGDRTITAAKLALGVIPTPDTTLSQSGVPADAKTAGDEISELRADLGYLYPGEYDVASGLYIDYASSTLKAIPASYDYSECVVCIAAEAGKTYKVVKKTKTIMRVGVGASDSLGAGDALVGIVRHTSQADGDTPLYVTTDADNTYIYIQLYTGDASTDYKNISANIASLTICEEFSQEITGIKEAIAEIVPGLSEDAKSALLNCFAHVAWTDTKGQKYYDALEAAMNGEEPEPDPETWDYEWDFSEGTPDQNGMLYSTNGTASATLKSDGVQLQVENTSGKKAQYYYTDTDHSTIYTKGVFELEFKVDEYGSYSVAPYGNGVRMNLGMGAQGGSGAYGAELCFNTTGVLHLISSGNANTWETISATPFVVGTTYKVRCEQDSTGTKIYVDDVLVGTATGHYEMITNQVFCVYRGATATFKSFRFRLEE